MRRPISTLILCCVSLLSFAQNHILCGPVPTENQLRWKEMEMYAFIHYSLNTYTNQEWGFGNEDPKLFNPSNLAPDITQDMPNSGEKFSSNYYIFFGADKMMFVTLNDEANVTGFRYLPPQDSREGLVTHYRISATTDWQKWETLGEGDFSNIVNNPIWQTVRCKPTRAKIIRMEGLRLAQGERMSYSDIEVVTEK